MTSRHEGQRRSRWIDALILAAVVFVCLALLLQWLWHCPEDISDRGKQDNARRQVAIFEAAVRAYHRDQGKLPASLEVLVPAYVESIPFDPWGHRYSYKRYEREAQIWCYGKNGRPRGYGVDVDFAAIVRLSDGEK